MRSSSHSNDDIELGFDSLDETNGNDDGVVGNSEGYVDKSFYGNRSIEEEQKMMNGVRDFKERWEQERGSNGVFPDWFGDNNSGEILSENKGDDLLEEDEVNNSKQRTKIKLNVFPLLAVSVVVYLTISIAIGLFH